MKGNGHKKRVQHVRRIDKARLDLVLRGAVSSKEQSAAAQRLGQMRSPRSKNHVTTTNRTNKAKRNINPSCLWRRFAVRAASLNASKYTRSSAASPVANNTRRCFD